MKDGPHRSEEIARLKKRSDLSLPDDRKKLDKLAHKLANKIWSALQEAESCLGSLYCILNRFEYAANS